MEIAESLTPECVVILSAATKRAALDELTAVLAEHTASLECDTLREAVWKREEMMSTGIGNGLAIPHVRLEGLAEVTMAVGISRGGLADYESLDGRRVHVIVLIAAPAGQHEAYIRLLAKTAEVFKHPELRTAMIETADAGQAYRILTTESAEPQPEQP